MTANTNRSTENVSAKGNERRIPLPTGRHTGGRRLKTAAKWETSALRGRTSGHEGPNRDRNLYQHALTCVQAKLPRRKS